jgi:2-oxoglutarate ferredoxin oxidoreductase subunit alpha
VASRRGHSRHRGRHTATGLEHTPAGRPASTAENHARQLDKRARKIAVFDYGGRWADIEGEGSHAVITWGSTTGPVREAVRRLRGEGVANLRTLSIRLLSPARPEEFATAMQGVERVLVVEQSHSAQFHRYLRAHYDLPDSLQVFHRAGPLLMRAGELAGIIRSWSKS